MDSIVLLGTGCPSPSHERFGPSTLVTSGNQNILIDAGSGVTQRLSEHGLKPSDIGPQQISGFSTFGNLMSGDELPLENSSATCTVEKKGDKVVLVIAFTADMNVDDYFKVGVVSLV